MKTLFYWDGIIAPEELIKHYTPAFEKLRLGQYKGVNLEKLARHKIYSIRINDTHRLLFTTLQIGSQRCLLLLEEVLNHDYHKSRFLNPKVLEAYLEKKERLFAETPGGVTALENYEFSPYKGRILDNEEEEKEEGEGKELLARPLSFYDQHFIEFNANQHQALRATLPVIVNGVAGSGKTCIALSIVANAVKLCMAEEKLDQPKTKLLYVAQSKGLVDTIRRFWQNHPSAQWIDEQQVEISFLSYAALFAQYGVRDDDKEYAIVDKEAFTTWLDKICSTSQGKGKNAEKKARKKRDEKSEIKLSYQEVIRSLVSKSQHTAKEKSQRESDKNRLYQEFRIIAGHGKEDYLKLGKGQSNFTLHREQLFAAFVAYNEFLEHNTQRDPALSRLYAEQQYDLIVVDEAQDLSLKQLQALYHLAINEHIAFCIDSHQSINDSLAKINYLQSLSLRERQRLQPVPMELICLAETYRCPKAAIALVNEVLLIKYSLTGGLSHKEELSAINASFSDDQGSLQWLETLSETDQISLRSLTEEHSDVAVITLAKYKEEAQQLFKTPLVFTPEEIKGLQYRSILLFKLLDDNHYYEANKLLTASIDADIEKRSEKTIHRPKQNTGNTCFAIPFNNLFIALTRATNDIIIIQENVRSLQALVTRLQKTLAHAVHRQEPETIHLQADWNAEFLRLFQENKMEQAKGVFISKLGKTEKEFKDYCATVTNNQDSSTKPATDPKKDSPEAMKKQRKRKAKKRTEPTTAETVSKPEPVLSQQATMVLNKKRAYPIKLLDQFNHKNLKTLFSSPDFEALMFMETINEHENLFKAILIDAKKTTILFEFLDKKPDFARKLTAEYLYKRVTIKGHPLENSSPLYWLTASEEGCDLFTVLLECNPSLTQKISAEDLCLPRTAKAEKDANTSVLLHLCKDHLGRTILRSLFHINPDLVQGISAEALCRLVTAKNSTFRNSSPLYWLCEGFNEMVSGPEILEILFSKNSKLVKEISMEALCCPIIAKDNSDHDNTTALYWLCSSCHGRDIFLYLLANHPILALEISSETLNYSTSVENKSVLDKLIDSMKGHRILYELFNRRPSLAKELVPKILYGIKGRSSPIISRFFASDVGLKILLILFIQYPALVQKIPPELFSNKEIMLRTCDNPEGRKLLQKLIQNPAFAKGITAKALCQRVSVHTNDTPLFYLCTGPDGLQILIHLLRDNPALAKKISPEILVNSYTNNCFDTMASPLFWLCSQDEGYLILQTLLTENPGLAKKITSDRLYRPIITQEDVPYANASVFYMLCKSEGLPVLQDLFAKNSALAQELTSKVLCRTLASTTGANISALSNLAATTEGCDFLYHLFSINKALAQSIPLKVWLLATGNQSSLALLVQNSRGKILALLPKSIQKEAEKLVIKEEKPTQYDPGFFSTIQDQKESLSDPSSNKTSQTDDGPGL